MCSTLINEKFMINFIGYSRCWSYSKTNGYYPWLNSEYCLCYSVNSSHCPEFTFDYYFKLYSSAKLKICY